MASKIDHPEQDQGPIADQAVTFATAGPTGTGRTVHDSKELREAVEAFGFSDDDTKQMRILDQGTRLDADATYLNLVDDPPHEIHARGDELVGPHDLYLAKDDMPFEWWNRLIGIRDPQRTKRAAK